MCKIEIRVRLESGFSGGLQGALLHTAEEADVMSFTSQRAGLSNRVLHLRTLT